MGHVSGFIPSHNGLHFSNRWPSVPDKMIGTPFGDISIGDASNGLCGGMAFAVRDLFEAGCMPPDSSKNPAANSPAFNFIVDRLFDSFNLPTGVATYYEWMGLPRHDTWLGPHGISWRTIKESMPEIRSTIDAGHPCPLGLVCSRSTDPRMLGENHQVLAWGYEDQGAVATLYIYDPNEPNRDDVTLTFETTKPQDTTDFHYSLPGRTVFGFFAVDYSPRDPSPLYLDGLVSFVQPAPNMIVQGIVTLKARAPGATRLAFTANYATNPVDPTSVGWRMLGEANRSSSQPDFWVFEWDSRQIYDQGNTGWGTVNLAATALDSAGNAVSMDARDYCRVDVSNNVSYCSRQVTSLNATQWQVHVVDSLHGVVSGQVFVNDELVGNTDQPISPRPKFYYVLHAPLKPDLPFWKTRVNPNGEVHMNGQRLGIDLSNVWVEDPTIHFA